ncbi:hypothetical protein F4W09_16855 [Acinetobacter tandoii]|jgi:hypothetical protein|uniref:Uncharacterized protein n=1 Tax=Acinetobacter tandoii TaxID=202954 RepID=A0A5N4W2C3_9GAMM|nr:MULTISPECIES: hypothetical protein [Acinetobacter]AUX86474.1 hypothetical protein C3F34_10755 [Acinetobacter sp. ACNIH2]KAB1851144.1 hypothetical protein F4W09_16855 [Acinetobacter tandoii]UOG18246.1 hypothetical protein MP622_01015 [Acinetobacter sp. PK01]
MLSLKIYKFLVFLKKKQSFKLTSGGAGLGGTGTGTGTETDKDQKPEKSELITDSSKSRKL